MWPSAGWGGKSRSVNTEPGNSQRGPRKHGAQCQLSLGAGHTEPETNPLPMIAASQRAGAKAAQVNKGMAAGAPLVVLQHLPKGGWPVGWGAGGKGWRTALVLGPVGRTQCPASKPDIFISPFLP